MSPTAETHEIAARGSRTLLERYREVRAFTEKLCDPLLDEDCAIQSMPDASPTKWHLAHTTWFFETFFLPCAIPQHRPFDRSYGYLFNSYYNNVGAQFLRARRGLLSRPSLAEVRQYRRHVDDLVLEVLSASEPPPGLAAVFELGLNHEQQHQELILTDVKHLLSCNPLQPVYRERPAAPGSRPDEACWLEYPEGLQWIGHEGGGFAFDNEGPSHREFVHAFRLADRAVTNAEYTAFIEDGGYTRPELWLSAGWDVVRNAGWQAPLYWEKQGDSWFSFTLSGYRKIDPAEPVTHVSYFEADAFARWTGARLPSEAEWETAASGSPVDGNFVETGRYSPAPAGAAPSGAPRQMLGDVWEWTRSPYGPYPGYEPEEGALGEYNGKFMCNQMVLRGGSCATPRSHIRTTYRNFFAPEARWQFSGIRLARDGE